MTRPVHGRVSYKAKASPSELRECRTPRLRRRRGLQSTSRRALELLASCPDGATGTILMATHGLTTEMLVDLMVPVIFGMSMPRKVGWPTLQLMVMFFTIPGFG
jgi:hypothetical protein